MGLPTQTGKANLEMRIYWKLRPLLDRPTSMRYLGNETAGVNKLQILPSTHHQSKRLSCPKTLLESSRDELQLYPILVKLEIFDCFAYRAIKFSKMQPLRRLQSDIYWRNFVPRFSRMRVFYIILRCILS